MKRRPPIAEVFSQGDELVLGQIADTNAAWLSGELVSLGFDVSRHTTVGDQLEALTAALREIAGRADCCVCTGGLGPTQDDLTAQAVSQAFGLELAFDPEAFRQIEACFTARGQPMPAVNRKQALLPSGSQRLDNLWGTAPGFSLRWARCRFYFLPGVPGEMQAMFERWIRPDLPRIFSTQPRRRVSFRTLGIGESALQELIAPLPVPAEVAVGFRATPSEVQLKLLFPAAFDPTSQAEVIGQYRKVLEKWTYCVEGVGEAEGELADLAGLQLLSGGQRLSLAESTTGGELARLCGQRRWLPLALTFSDTATLLEHFALDATASGSEGGTEALAIEAASRLRRSTAVDYGLVQVEDSRTDGRVRLHSALCGPDGSHAESRSLQGNPERLRMVAAAHALDFLRRHLAASRDGS
jgi:nicotinamide-nucleotide amidase